MSKKIVGLTGGIGSGKSLAAAQFANLGVTVIDADKIAKEIVKPNTLLLKKIVEKFGNSIINIDGSLDRSQLRQIIFSDHRAKNWLEKLLHPVILNKMIQQAKKATSPYCIFVLPLLFEARLEKLVDRILVIDSPKALRIKRISQRDHISTKEVQKMIDSQITRKERLAKADDCVKNTSTVLSLKKQIKEIHEFYLNILT